MQTYTLKSCALIRIKETAQAPTDLCTSTTDEATWYQDSISTSAFTGLQPITRWHVSFPSPRKNVMYTDLSSRVTYCMQIGTVCKLRNRYGNPVSYCRACAIGRGTHHSSWSFAWCLQRPRSELMAFDEWFVKDDWLLSNPQEKTILTHHTQKHQILALTAAINLYDISISPPAPVFYYFESCPCKL